MSAPQCVLAQTNRAFALSWKPAIRGGVSIKTRWAITGLSYIDYEPGGFELRVGWLYLIVLFTVAPIAWLFKEDSRQGRERCTTMSPVRLRPPWCPGALSGMRYRGIYEELIRPVICLAHHLLRDYS